MAIWQIPIEFEMVEGFDVSRFQRDIEVLMGPNNSGLSSPQHFGSFEANDVEIYSDSISLRIVPDEIFSDEIRGIMKLVIKHGLVGFSEKGEKISTMEDMERLIQGSRAKEYIDDGKGCVGKIVKTTSRKPMRSVGQAFLLATLLTILISCAIFGFHFYEKQSIKNLTIALSADITRMAGQHLDSFTTPEMTAQFESKDYSHEEVSKNLGKSHAILKSMYLGNHEQLSNDTFEVLAWTTEGELTYGITVRHEGGTGYKISRIFPVSSTDLRLFKKLFINYNESGITGSIQ